MRKMPIVLAVLTALLLAAIATTGSQAKPQKAAVTTVTLTGWASSPAETDALKATIAGFERTHKSINVDYAPINGDYPAAMLAQFAARKPPDVFYVDSNVAARLGDAGRARSRSTARSRRTTSTRSRSTRAC